MGGGARGVAAHRGIGEDFVVEFLGRLDFAGTPFDIAETEQGKAGERRGGLSDGLVFLFRGGGIAGGGGVFGDAPCGEIAQGMLRIL